jgi:hypothetical protein
MRRIFLLSLLGLAFAMGCGDSKHASNIEFEKGGTAGTAGETDKGGSGGEAGKAGGGAGADTGGAGGDSGGSTAVNLPGAPVVTFESPKSVLDPNADGVITTETVTVSCKAVASDKAGSTVDPATAKITLTQNGKEITTGQVSTAMVSGARVDEFLLNDQTEIKSGIITFDCSAEDNSSPALIGTAKELNLLVDRGPTITVIEPSEQQNVALSAGVNIDFTIDTKAIADGDDKYALHEYSVTINGQTVTVAETSAGSGHYTGHVPLDDTTLFPSRVQPDGPTILQIVADNERGRSVQKTVTFSVDSTPPTITIQSPERNSIVGKTTTVAFTVEDKGSGVDESTVLVRVNAGKLFPYAANDAAHWKHDKGSINYYFTFSANEFASSETQATINIYATDTVKNSTSPGATIALFVDTQPPYISLDPPTVRVIYYSEKAFTEVCSAAFDPVGEAINDLTIDNGDDLFRALVWDMTNEPRDPNLIRYLANVDPESVTLYLGERADTPLLIDTDKDSICDDVDVGTKDNPKVALKLSPITKMGYPPAPGNDPTTYANADDTRYYKPAPDTTGICQRDGFLPDTTWPFLCKSTSDMVRVIHHSVDTSTPIEAIFGNAPVKSVDAIGCTGTYWSYFSVLKQPDPKVPPEEGWLCFVAVADDKVRNRGVSAPLRICYDDPNTAYVPDCAKNPTVQDTTYHDEWKSYIRHGSLDKPFRAKSSDPNPPSCAKDCKLRTTENDPKMQEFDRFITNQKYQ